MKRSVTRKRFGQHFLTDAGVINALVEAIAPRKSERIVEIGPGAGALTRPLISRVDCLRVVEIDRDIVARLKREFPPEKLLIAEGDALRFDFGTFADGAKMRLVGNLPYNISTPLLFHLEKYADRVIDMHFMLQKEVVDRLAATPRTADYGRLSVMLQYRYVIDRLFDVPPESFDPPPKVDSSVVRMIPRRPEDLKARDELRFSRLVRAAFSQRRKMLRNTLKDEVGDADLARVGISPSARAEELSVDDYVRLANQGSGIRDQVSGIRNQESDQ
ncbi:MAG: 16S rRNA (adenine(1518)-N(6)/adenine(1519)-N(6))-dimethyltransferase RsmA [Candidatus Accumulibacter sp.]|nr:16S rRNA (adenine(1518)-N(6)/adenine(1519)-N(6))-dimethyltransferase RsmA [Accumulibacter sp.]